MKKELLNKRELQTPDLLSALLLTRLYDPGGNGPTISQVLEQQSLSVATESLEQVNRLIATTPQDVITRILPRAASWNYQSTATAYAPASNVEDLLSLAAQYMDSEREPQRWWATTVAYETRAALKRKQSAAELKSSYRRETLTFKIRQLQQSPDVEYGDTFNRLVCQLADNLGITDLSVANIQFKQELAQEIDDSDIINFLAAKEYQKEQRNLNNLLAQAKIRLELPELALRYCALRFDLKLRQTDACWGNAAFETVLANAFNGQPLNLTTMLCTINEFDYQGGYNLNPDLNTYLTNSKVEPIPLIVAEMAQLLDLFRFYGLSPGLTIYVADTDYTEIEANGPVTPQNLANLEKYMANLSAYCQTLGSNIVVLRISDLTAGNPPYLATKARVLKWVTEGDNYDFNRLWGKKWEEDIERRNETFSKKKLVPPDQMRKASLAVAQRLWAVNAAQGAAFSNLGPQTVLLSTERRERDSLYVVDKESTISFPPVLYVLKAAENWNRKIVNKDIYQPN